MQRILVADRGAAASRLIRSIQEAGLEAVAIGSANEHHFPHMEEADYSVSLPGTRIEETYQNGPRIVTAAMDSGCDAVHPGFGKMASNAAFAKQVIGAGLTWMGSEPGLLALLNDRLHCRQVAEQLGISVPLGSGAVMADETSLQQGMRLGAPLFVKAAHGEGNLGIGRVERIADLLGAITRARRRAAHFHEDDRVYLEKWVDRARHVEVQLVADRHGDIVTVGDRDCSIQHRLHRLVEECPAPDLDESLRLSLSKSSMRLAKALGLAGAFTVRFLVTPDARAFFLEVRPQLLDDLTVTEMVYGVDLVDAQIRIAKGEHLGWAQKEIVAKGYAIGLRLCAEDPEEAFAPTHGVISRLQVPVAGRVEVGAREGGTISTGGDGLLARFCILGPTRQAVIVRARIALDEVIVDGPKTNLEVLKRITSDEQFWRGDFDVEFLGKVLGYSGV